MCWGNVQRTNRSSFYTCMHASIRTYVRTRRYTYPFLCMHVHACTCIYIQIPTCTYTAQMHYTYTANIQTYIQTLRISKYNFNPLWLQLVLWQSLFGYKRIHLPYELKPRQEQSDSFGQQVQGMPSQEGLDLSGMHTKTVRCENKTMKSVEDLQSLMYGNWTATLHLVILALFVRNTCCLTGWKALCKHHLVRGECWNETLTCSDKLFQMEPL